MLGALCVRLYAEILAVPAVPFARERETPLSDASPAYLGHPSRGGDGGGGGGGLGGGGDGNGDQGTRRSFLRQICYNLSTERFVGVRRAAARPSEP